MSIGKMFFALFFALAIMAVSSSSADECTYKPTEFQKKSHGWHLDGTRWAEKPIALNCVVKFGEQYRDYSERERSYAVSTIRVVAEHSRSAKHVVAAQISFRQIQNFHMVAGMTEQPFMPRTDDSALGFASCVTRHIVVNQPGKITNPEFDTAEKMCTAVGLTLPNSIIRQINPREFPELHDIRYDAGEVKKIVAMAQKDEGEISLALLTSFQAQ